jgi:hypothetical protein
MRTLIIVVLLCGAAFGAEGQFAPATTVELSTAGTDTDYRPITAVTRNYDGVNTCTTDLRTGVGTSTCVCVGNVWDEKTGEWVREGGKPAETRYYDHLQREVEKGPDNKWYPVKPKAKPQETTGK